MHGCDLARLCLSPAFGDDEDPAIQARLAANRLLRREASARKDALVIRKQKSGRPAMPTCCSFETSTLVASRLTPGSRRWSRVAYSVCEVIAEQQLDGFIDKFAPEMRGRIRDCRAKVQGRLPSAV